MEDGAAAGGFGGEDGDERRELWGIDDDLEAFYVFHAVQFRKRLMTLMESGRPRTMAAAFFTSSFRAG